MNKYDFIDLFAGIGGIRKGFEQSRRFRCVFSCENDKKAAETYRRNFKHDPLGDVTSIDTSALPDFDVLAAGFPCQPFSMSGNRLGFDDTRGTLFFDVARIIKEKSPQAVFLENVKGLVTHDHGRTFAVIENVLRELGYHVHAKVIDASSYVPQRRERIYIVGIKSSVPQAEWMLGGNAPLFSFPSPGRTSKKVGNILQARVEAGKFLSSKYWNGLREHRRRQEAAGRGFGYEIVDPSSCANTIVCGGMGRERNLVIDHDIPDPYPADRNEDHVRMMTPREWARLQGFPEGFKLPKADSIAYKQLGNSVAVPVVHAIAKNIALAIDGMRIG